MKLQNIVGYGAVSYILMLVLVLINYSIFDQNMLQNFMLNPFPNITFYAILTIGIPLFAFLFDKKPNMITSVIFGLVRYMFTLVIAIQFYSWPFQQTIMNVMITNFFIMIFAYEVSFWLYKKKLR